jgi:hypothetical protein
MAASTPYHAAKRRQGLKRGRSTNAAVLGILGRLGKPLKAACTLAAEHETRELEAQFSYAISAERTDHA